MLVTDPYLFTDWIIFKAEFPSPRKLTLNSNVEGRAFYVHPNFILTL